MWQIQSNSFRERAVPYTHLDVYKRQSLDDTETYERFCGYGTKMIASEEGWSAFMAAYCPGIPYYETWDFSQDVLVTSVSHGAKPGYNQADVIASVKWNGSYVVTEYSNDPANFVYALNPMSEEVLSLIHISGTWPGGHGRGNRRGSRWRC